MTKNIFEGLIGIDEAADYSGFTTRHIRLLLFRGKIQGKKIGRDWITTKEEIDKYLKLERKPGRKSKAS
jgi:excisionase family DNA binding protein